MTVRLMIPRKLTLKCIWRCTEGIANEEINSFMCSMLLTQLRPELSLRSPSIVWRHPRRRTVDRSAVQRPVVGQQRGVEAEVKGDLVANCGDEA